MAEDVRLERRDGRVVLRYRLPIPYFAFLWRPLVARRARAVAAALEAGRPPPDDVPWWAPPAPQAERATVAVACLALLSAMWSYAGGTGGLLTETLPYAAHAYHVGNRGLGAGLSVYAARAMPLTRMLEAASAQAAAAPDAPVLVAVFLPR